MDELETAPEDGLQAIIDEAREEEDEETWRSLVHKVVTQYEWPSVRHHLASLGVSSRECDRVIAADILCAKASLGGFNQADIDLLWKLADDSADDVAIGAIHGLGFHGDPKAIELLLTRVAHPSASIRHAVASALSRIFARVESSADEVAPAIDPLIVLSKDPDPDVRSWATFGFVLNFDITTPEILAALEERRWDPAHDVRCEAQNALALRDDTDAILWALANSDVDTDILDAAVRNGSDEAREGVRRLLGDPEAWTSQENIAAALRRFPPDDHRRGGEMNEPEAEAEAQRRNQRDDSGDEWLAVINDEGHWTVERREPPPTNRAQITSESSAARVDQ